MNRVWDYVSFAVWFFGLGYIVMWLLNSPYLATFSPVMHGLGMASATFVPLRLLIRALLRRRAAALAVRPVCTGNSDAVLRPRWQGAGDPLRPVKARNHFGLRGMPD